MKKYAEIENPGNAMKDDFQKHMSRQPFPRIPDHWKTAILDAAHPIPTSGTEQPLWKIVHGCLHDLFWPSPVAWVGLAVAWVGIAVMNYQADTLVKSSSVNTFPITQEMIISFQEQRWWVQNELDDELFFSDPLDRPKKTPPSRREKRIPLLLMAG